jgi:hypothetical protein
MTILLSLKLMIALLALAVVIGIFFLLLRWPKIVLPIVGVFAFLVIVIMGLFTARVTHDFGGLPSVVALPPAKTQVNKPPQSDTAESSNATTEKPDRPDWVEQPGQLQGAVYKIGVKSGLYVTLVECQRALELAEREAVDQYVETYCGAGASQMTPLDATFIRNYLQKAEYQETTLSSVGKMQQLHVLLAFDDEARRVIHERWEQARIGRRLAYVGAGAASILALVAAAYGYLQITNRRAGASRNLAVA